MHLSLRRFRTERWWEKTADVYSNLLGAIHDAKAFSEEYLAAEYRNRRLSDEEDKVLREKYRQSESVIYRAMDVGSFYLSQEAIDCLKTYRKESSSAIQEDSWQMYLQADLDATNRCLHSMIEIARRHLKVK